MLLGHFLKRFRASIRLDRPHQKEGDAMTIPFPAEMVRSLCAPSCGVSVSSLATLSDQTAGSVDAVLQSL